jgi:hypothetical protein
VHPSLRRFPAHVLEEKVALKKYYFNRGGGLRGYATTCLATRTCETQLNDARWNDEAGAGVCGLAGTPTGRLGEVYFFYCPKSRFGMLIEHVALKGLDTTPKHHMLL